MLKRDDKLVCLPSHGENRGSSPLGSANIFKDLADCDPSASNTCPINVCGQRWTIRFASGPRLEGGRLGTNAPIVKDVARFETGIRKCGLMKNPHSRRSARARSRQVIGWWLRGGSHRGALEICATFQSDILP